MTTRIPNYVLKNSTIRHNCNNDYLVDDTLIIMFDKQAYTANCEAINEQVPDHIFTIYKDELIDRFDLKAEDINLNVQATSNDLTVIEFGPCVVEKNNAKKLHWFIKQDREVIVSIVRPVEVNHYRMIVHGESFDAVVVIPITSDGDNDNSDYHWYSPISLKYNKHPLREYVKMGTRYNYTELGLHIKKENNSYRIFHTSSDITLPYVYAKTLKRARQLLECVALCPVDWTMRIKDIHNFNSENTELVANMFRVLDCVTRDIYNYNAVMDLLKQGKTITEVYNSDNIVNT